MKNLNDLEIRNELYEMMEAFGNKGNHIEPDNKSGNFYGFIKDYNLLFRYTNVDLTTLNEIIMDIYDVLEDHYKEVTEGFDEFVSQQDI